MVVDLILRERLGISAMSWLAARIRLLTRDALFCGLSAPPISEHNSDQLGISLNSNDDYYLEANGRAVSMGATFPLPRGKFMMDRAHTYSTTITIN